jgi:hypothetical protein
VSLQRMNACLERGTTRGIDTLDGAASTRNMVYAAGRQDCCTHRNGASSRSLFFLGRQRLILALRFRENSRKHKATQGALPSRLATDFR